MTVWTLQSKVRSPSLFPKLFLVIWTHKTSIRDKFSCDNTTDLPFPIVVDSIGGRGKTHSKDQTRLKFFYSKKMRVNWRSKMCKNHQITGFQSHHKSLIFRRPLLMFNEFWGSGNEQENWFLELQTYKEIAFAIKSFTLWRGVSFEHHGSHLASFSFAHDFELFICPSKIHWQKWNTFERCTKLLAAIKLALECFLHCRVERFYHLWWWSLKSFYDSALVYKNWKRNKIQKGIENLEFWTKPSVDCLAHFSMVIIVSTLDDLWYRLLYLFLQLFMD